MLTFDERAWGWPRVFVRLGLGDESKSTRFFLWLIRVFVDPPATLLAYAVGIPLHLIGSYVSRKRCPRCGARSLSGFYSRPHPVGVCTRCHSLYEYRDGRWEYVGHSGE